MASPAHMRLELQGHLATLTLCRPESRNVMTHAWIEELQSHASRLQELDTLRCILIRHEGPVLSVGADVKTMAAQQHRLGDHLDSLISPVHEALHRIFTLPAVVVCMLDGTAAGGGASLALGCDFLLATPSSRLVFAYPRLGTTPDAGLSHALIERLGAPRALQLFLTAEAIDMAQAKQLGLVHEVFAEPQVQPKLLEMIATLTATRAAVEAKRLFLQPRAGLLAERLDRERESFLRCAETIEFRERALAFASRIATPSAEPRAGQP